MVIKNRLKAWLNDSVRYSLVISRGKIMRKKELVELEKELFKVQTPTTGVPVSAKLYTIALTLPPKPWSS